MKLSTNIGNRYLIKTTLVSRGCSL